MSRNRTGGPPRRRGAADARQGTEPAPPMPAEVGQDSPNPLPDEARPKHQPSPNREREHTEDLLDRGLEETFPASDPVSIQGDR